MLNNNMLGFVHIPKNGGSSVKQWFEQNHIELANHGHKKFCEIDQQQANWWFAISRNPYHRVVSYYEFTRIKSQRVLLKNRNQEHNDLHQNRFDLYSTGFENWLENFGQHVPQFLNTQHSYITNANSQVNCVLKLENIERDWRTINIITKVNMPLGRVNTTVKTLSQYYTARAKEFVCETFREDFKYFDYSVDNL